MVGIGRFVLDRRTRRVGDVIVGGSPLRLFRLTAGGRAVIDALVDGRPLPPGHQRLTGPLLAAGAIHPLVGDAGDEPGAPYTAADVTIVTPVFRSPPDFTGADVHPSALIAVDDASPEPVEVRGARVVRRPINGGPGAARNTGLTEVHTALVAFVDTDITLPDGWLATILGHFADPAVALVAPRVASGDAVPSGSAAVARFESLRSPLDLGSDPAPVRIGGRISYVPAAAIICRADALRAVGGFDETLRTGEDVDLVWRLNDAGYVCRYEPGTVVHHRPRPTVAAMLGQRVAYGRSAAPLAARHPGALTPIRVNRWSVAVWAALLAKRPLLATAVAAGTAVSFHRRLRPLPTGESVRLTLSGHLAAGQQLAAASRRVWWPILVGAMPFSRLARRVALGAVIPIIVEAAGAPRRGGLDPLRYAVLAIADDAAYGLGVWRGARAEGRPDPLLPGYRSPR